MVPPESRGTSVRSRERSASAWKRLERLAWFLSKARAAALALLRRYLPNEAQHLFALTLVVGVACGLVAVAFHLAIRAAEALLIDRAMGASGASFVVWTILTPTFGGLLAGAMLTWVVPGARGSGIPQVKQAFAKEGGQVRFRDALGKFLIGSLQIGSGASLGREGPTVQICAGAASALARVTALPPRNMRRLLPVGVAAGIAAAFNAPIAAVTFTIEEIVGTLDHTVLSGVVVAAALAAVTERGILGVHPVIEVAQPHALEHPSCLVFYAILGLVASVVAVAFTDGLLKLRLAFRRLRAVPAWVHPAVGGLVTGVFAALALGLLGTTGVTGGGYATLSKALAGQLGLRALLVLCVVKLVATVFSYSSGGAGGIFAPSLFMGAMLGGSVGFLDVAVLHHDRSELGAFALVGMGAVFAGVIRAPLTSVLIIFEMTGDYGLVLPLMLANTTAYVLARRWRPLPIYEALLAQDGITLPHATSPKHTLEQLVVVDAMTSNVVSVLAEALVEDAARLVSGRQFTCLPVVDGERQVVGVVSLAHLRDETMDRRCTVEQVARTAATIRADASLLSAVVRMNELGVRQLLVVCGEPEEKLVGVLAMSDLVRAHAKAASRPGASAPASIRPSAVRRLRAVALMASAPLVSGAASLEDLERAFMSADVGAVLVRDPTGGFRAVLRDQVRELARDEDLERLLVAADVACATVSVHPEASALELARSLDDAGAEVALVVVPQNPFPLGIVSRNQLALALLEAYSRGSPSSPPA